MAAGTTASVSKTATGTSAAIPVDKHGTGEIPIGLILDFTTVAAVGTASVEGTFDDPSDSAAVWLAIDTMTGKTATAMTREIMPWRGVRLNCTAYTSGTITLRVSQGVAD
jgi:hypothetical protein